MKPIQSPSELRRGRNILWSQKTLLSKAGKTSPEKKKQKKKTDKYLYLKTLLKCFAKRSQKYTKGIIQFEHVQFI